MQITNAEWKIMDLLWKQGPKTIMELTRALQGETNWSKQAVAMMLQRMEEKGMVRWIKDGKARQYFTMVSRGEAEETEVNAVKDKVFEGSPSLLISAMVRQQQINEKEIDEICAMLGLKRK